MYCTEKRLKDLLSNIVNEGRMSDSDALKLVSLTRQLLEEKEEKSKYLTLNFYCNWCLHTKITQLETCYSMLSRITDVFLSDDGSKKVDITRLVSELISIKQLRMEFIGLYSSSGLPRFLFEGYRNWRGFMGQIIKEVRNKPIGFPEKIEKYHNKKANRIYREMLEKAKGRELMVARKLSLSDEIEDKKKGDVYWIVETGKRVRIVGRLLFGESKTDFLFE